MCQAEPEHPETNKPPPRQTAGDSAGLFSQDPTGRFTPTTTSNHHPFPHTPPHPPKEAK